MKEYSIPIGIATVALGIQSLQSILLPSIVPAPTKPYGDFDTFYRKIYLPEHHEDGTKLWHLLGTTLLFVLLSRKPILAVALTTALVTGYTVFPFLRGVPTGLSEMAIMMGTYIIVGNHLTKDFKFTILLPVVAYTCAWAGHFLVEHNKPATFIYPTFSLMGDFRMIGTMIMKMSTSIEE